MSGKRRKCGARTALGSPCENYWDTCPYPSHKTRRGKRKALPRVASHSVDLDASPPTRDGSAGVIEATPLADNRAKFESLVSSAANAYGFPPEMIVHDYWLVRTLYAWQSRMGGSQLLRAYPTRHLPAGSSAGKIMFGGGTSLSAAWNVTERWSEDIDLVLDPDDDLKPKQFKASCKAAAVTVSKSLGGAYNSESRSAGHFFFKVTTKDSPALSNVDIVRQDAIAHPIWAEHMPVTSLVGRLAGDEDLSAHPELGGFDFLALGPGTTAMNKLLAQTQMSESGDLNAIRYRARDVYDLASIALCAGDFEGHIGRDSPALLHIAQQWRQPGSPPRPPDGFASIRSFDPSTSEHEALAEGYETMQDQLVWGEKIPLDEAISLALSLDPGPAEPFQPPPYGDHHGVGYPRL